MSPLKRLHEIAREIADHHQTQASNLKRQLLEIETRKTQIEAELRTANRAHERAMSFPGQIGSDYACPDCCVRGVSATMRSIGGGGKHEDLFRCNTCQQVTALPSGE